LRPLHLALALLLAAAAGFWFYSGQLRDRYQEPASRYLAVALTDISRWQPEAVEYHLAPEARAVISAEQLTALAARYRELGRFENLDNLEFARISALAPLLGGERLLNYGGDVRFANGQAHLTATLVERDGQLRLYNFNLSSPQGGDDGR
jgi:hypothetical protein